MLVLPSFGLGLCLRWGTWVGEQDQSTHLGVVGPGRAISCLLVPTVVSVSFSRCVLVSLSGCVWRCGPFGPSEYAVRDA
jgi:hypothetical protein